MSLNNYNKFKNTLPEKYGQYLLDNMDNIIKDFNEHFYDIQNFKDKRHIRFHYINYLFKLVYDREDKAFFIVSPYSPEFWFGVMQSEIKIMEFELSSILADALIKQFNIKNTFQNKTRLISKIDKYFDINNPNKLFFQHLYCYKDYKKQLDLFYKLINKDDLKRLKHLEKYQESLQELLNDEIIIDNGFSEKFTEMDMDETINNKRPSLNGKKLKITHLNKKSLVCCHVIPHQLLRHSNKKVKNLYIGATQQVNMRMVCFENMIAQKIKRFYKAFDLYIQVSVTKNNELHICYICIIPNESKGFNFIIDDFIYNDEKYYYYENPIYSKNIIKEM